MGSVFDLLSTNVRPEIHRQSPFIQLMFNRMLASRSLLYKQAGGEELDLCSANEEITRTLLLVSRQAYAKKCKNMQLMLKRALKAVLHRSNEFSYA